MPAEISVVEMRQDGPDRFIAVIESEDPDCLVGMRADTLAIARIQERFGAYRPAIEPQFTTNMEPPAVEEGKPIRYRRRAVITAGK